MQAHLSFPRQSECGVIKNDSDGVMREGHGDEGCNDQRIKVKFCLVCQSDSVFHAQLLEAEIEY